MPRSKGRFFNFDGISTSAGKRSLGFGCDPVLRIAREAIERRKPTLLTTSKTAERIHELVFWGLEMDGARRSTGVFYSNVMSPPEGWSGGPQLCCL